MRSYSLVVPVMSFILVEFRSLVPANTGFIVAKLSIDCAPRSAPVDMGHIWTLMLTDESSLWCGGVE